MIKYQLICKSCDYKFDSWFASSKEYEKLKKRNTARLQYVKFLIEDMVKQLMIGY